MSGLGQSTPRNLSSRLRLQCPGSVLSHGTLSCRILLSCGNIDDGPFRPYPFQTTTLSVRRKYVDIVIYLLNIPNSQYPPLLISFISHPIYYLFLYPILCSHRSGAFCLGGVARGTVVEWLAIDTLSQPGGAFGFNRPQTCTEGTYCDKATSSATGTGLCFQGHYCPPNSTYPTEVPLGNFASRFGSPAPTLCLPGTYAPLTGQVVCSVCPAGHECQGYGVYIPSICLTGTYRMQVDTISCVLCSTGTFALEAGAPDISYCLPCPPGRVCGLQGMVGLNTSTACPSGNICGYGTTLETQVLLHHHTYLCPHPLLSPSPLLYQHTFSPHPQSTLILLSLYHPRPISPYQLTFSPTFSQLHHPLHSGGPSHPRGRIFPSRNHCCLPIRQRLPPWIYLSPRYPGFLLPSFQMYGGIVLPSRHPRHPPSDSMSTKHW